MDLGAPAGFTEIERGLIRRTVAGLLYLRLVVLPLFLGVAFWHWVTLGRRTIHLVLLCAFILAMAGAFVHLRWRVRQKAPDTLEFGPRGVFVAAMQVAACALTGGLDSPFVIVIPVIAAITAMAAERRYALLAAGAQIAGLPLLALVGGSQPLSTAGMLALGVAIGVLSGRAMRAMFEQMLGRALEAREDVLRLHGEQLKALTTLSGGIAHELKNPLASIKGLTGLALVELQDPARAGERLEVLRKEVSRMQKILEEFLNFSRPLSPLVLDRVDVRRICREVVELYQGLAHERGLVVHASGARAEVLCDPRKVKQVVINLVQNAIEASDEGGEVLLQVEALQGVSVIRVLDRGHGLGAELATRAFEPGVTTKARGSGLGLTLARSMVEQHGGTLALRPREGGGCFAELVLPEPLSAAVESEAAA